MVCHTNYFRIYSWNTLSIKTSYSPHTTHFWTKWSELNIYGTPTDSGPGTIGTKNKRSWRYFVWLFINNGPHNKGEVHPITGHEGPEVEERYSSTLSLTSALDGGGWSMPRPGRLPPGRPGTNCTGGWVGPRAGLDGCRKSRPYQDSPDRPARSKSLYQLSYPGPHHTIKAHTIYRRTYS
jgi:hypothetical protein